MNNRGMAISSILYTILVLFLVLLFGILGLISSAKTTFDALKNKLYTDLNERPPQLLYVDDDGEYITFKVLSKKYIDSYYVTETLDNLTLDQFNNLKTDLTNPLEKFNITYQIPSSYGNYIYLRSIHSVLYKYYVQIDNSTSTTKVTIVPVTEHTVLEINKFPVVFKQEGACIFNGSSENITGSGCQKYANTSYIDTGIALFSEANINKDFDLTLTIEEYNSDLQEDSQATVVSNMNDALVNSSTVSMTGFTIRKSNSNFNYLFRKMGSSPQYSINYGAKYINEIRIMRKNGEICYKRNNITDTEINYLDLPSEYYFDKTLIIGASRSTDGTPEKFFKGKLSNMTLRLGKDVDNTIPCG